MSEHEESLPAGTSLSSLVLAGAPIDELGSYLDGLSSQDRWAQVDGSPRRIQRLLYERAATSRPLTLNDFVPPGTPDGTPVVHRGWNSLPLPSLWRRFAKPMLRHPSRPDVLMGYNDSPARWLIGPGFFLHVQTPDEPGWRQRGATVVDYFQVPDVERPHADWPRVIPNRRGLQFFVYHKTRDFMRRVSQHVTIGAAFKTADPLGAYFMLVRQD